MSGTMELTGVHDGRVFRVAIKPKTNGFALCDQLIHILGLDVRPCRLRVYSLVQKDGNFPLELYAPICEGAEIRYSSALASTFESASPATGRVHICVVVDDTTRKRTSSSISNGNGGDGTPQKKRTSNGVLVSSSIEERSPKRLCGDRATIESIYIPITKRYTQATEPLPLSTIKMILSQLKVKTRVYGSPLRTTTTIGRTHTLFSKASAFMHVETIISHVMALVESNEDDEGGGEGKALAVDIRGALVEPETATSFQADLLIWKGARRLVVVCLADSLEQGREECLVLMEVAMALNNKKYHHNSREQGLAQTMFGIATDHTNWLFLKRTADMLEKETVNIESNVEHQAAGSGGVERVAGRIHHILKHS